MDNMWFKFRPDRWITGDISTVSPEIQGLFVNLCAHYMERRGILSTTEARNRLHEQLGMCRDKNALDYVFSKFCKISKGRMISILFLDEQIKHAINKSTLASKAVSTRYVAKASKPDVGPMWDRCGTDVKLRTYDNNNMNTNELDNSHAVEVPDVGPMWDRCEADVESMSNEEKTDVISMSKYKVLKDNYLEHTDVLRTNDQKTTDVGTYKILDIRNKEKEKIYKKEKNQDKFKIEKAIKNLSDNGRINLDEIEEKYFPGKGTKRVVDEYVDHFFGIGYSYKSDQGILTNFLAWINQLKMVDNFAQNEGKTPTRVKITDEGMKKLTRFLILMGQDSILSRFLSKHTGEEKKSLLSLKIEEYGIRKLVKLIYGYSLLEFESDLGVGTIDHFNKSVSLIKISENEFEQLIAKRKLNLFEKYD